MRCVKRFIGLIAMLAVWAHSLEIPKEELDKVIEEEITQKLSVDLLQSIERKFQVDLEKSVDMVLVKIKMLLQNGTSHIQDKLLELQGIIDIIKNEGENELETCLQKKQNVTTALAEKALHQMVVCGYALIGHDPSQAVTRVLMLKNMIAQGMKPVYAEKKEIYDLLKVCGHDHESLQKVVKCVISKSPVIKSAMMEITSKLIEGVVELTKLMAHGAMHEACLIEVVKTTEDEAFQLLKTVKQCARGNETSDEELNKYFSKNNATIIDIDQRSKSNNVTEAKDSTDVKDLIRRMLFETKAQDLDKTFKNKLGEIQSSLGSIDNNHINDKNGKDN